MHSVRMNIARGASNTFNYLKRDLLSVRSIQKTGVKGLGGKTERNRITGARFLLLRPAGYPLKSTFQEAPVVSDPVLFERYAKEQWYGELVRAGAYLFDRRLYPDFAFKVVKVYPREAVIGADTTIVVEKRIEPTAVVEPASFDDVVGQLDAKRKVKVIKRYLEEPEMFGSWAPRNILFYGASGTGKTMIARALATEANVSMLPVKSTSLIGEFVGEGARQIHNLYDRAEQLAPCIIFIDEIDAIALDRRYQDLRGDVSEIVNALLTEMDGISSRRGVCTIAATNKVDLLDPSIRSRFEEEIEFKLPSYEDRLEILRRNASKMPLKVSGDLAEIAKLTEGFSGRDLVDKILKVALHQAIIEDSRFVERRHLMDALQRIKRDVKEPPGEMFI